MKLAMTVVGAALLFAPLAVTSAPSPRAQYHSELDSQSAQRSPARRAAAPWPGTHPAPQLVMAPINALLDIDQVAGLVEEFVERTGFHGFHVPLHGERPGPGTLELLRRADERGFWVHLWMYGDHQSGRAPDDLDDDGGHAQRVAYDLAPFRNWSMGLGYDLQEWTGEREVARWIERVDEVAPGHLVGGRSVPGQQALPGGYAGWEHQVIDKARLEEGLRAAIARSGGRPVMSEDRFRVREVQDKDWTLQQVTEGIATLLRLNVAGIWGYRLDGSVNDLGSAPWPNAGELRAQLRGLEAPGHAPTLHRSLIHRGSAHSRYNTGTLCAQRFARDRVSAHEQRARP